MNHSILNYGKYIGQDPINLDVLSKLLDKPTGAISLVKAKPGAGKSNAFVEVCKERSESDKNHVYLIAEPFKMQVQQASNGYQVGGYIKGVKFNSSERVAFCIYDRLKEIATQYKNEGYKVHIVLDESHLIHGSYSYRQRAIQNVISLVGEFPVVMTTATPRLNLMADALGILKIDQLIEFISTQAREPHKTRILDVPSKDRWAIVSEIIEEQTKAHDLTVVRLNNKNMIDLYQDQLQGKGYKVGIVYTGLSESEEDVLSNIVENETITSDYDIILTTCKLDVGSNVNLEHKNICMLHASMTGADCDLDAIEQFPDRMRNGFATHIILTCSDYEKEAINFKDIYNQERKICKAKLEEADTHFSYMLEYMKGQFNAEQLIQADWLRNTDMSGESLADYCISLDKDNKLVLDEFKLLSRANRRYSEILYRRPDILEKVLIDYGIAQSVEFSVYEPKNTQETKEAIKEVVQAHKLTKAELDKQLDQSIEVLSGANDLSLGALFEGINEPLPEEYQEAYDFIANNYPKLLTAMYECLRVGYSHREVVTLLLENARTPKRGRQAHASLLKDMSLRMQYLKFNKAYKQGKLIEITDGSLGSEYKRIMEYMKDKDRPCITEELKEELTAFINDSKGKKSKKIDTKATAKALISIHFLDKKERLNLRTRHSHLFN